MLSKYSSGENAVNKTDSYREIYALMFNQTRQTINTLEKICNLADNLNEQTIMQKSSEVKEIISKIRYFADSEAINLKLFQLKSEKAYIEYVEKCFIEL